MYPTTSASKPNCSVCGADGDGAHFGAQACRACAAFFRRSIALSKSYRCRFSGQCSISTDIRCLCRACRFSKCLAVGMTITAVQANRDNLCLSNQQNHYQSDLISNESISPDAARFLIDRSLQSNLLTPMCTPTGSIMNTMDFHFTKLEQIRQVIHLTKGENLFKKRPPRPILYQEIHDIHKKEIPLIFDWVNASFPEFEILPVDQKKILFQNFYMPFGFLHGGHLCVVTGRTDIVMKPTGDYIDFEHPESLFDFKETDRSKEDIKRLFFATSEVYKRNVLLPMFNHKVTRTEFFALSAVVLWDYGLVAQSPECEELCSQMRTRITKELLNYYKAQLCEQEPAKRMSSLFLIIPNLERMVQRFQADIEMSCMFNVFNLDDSYCEFMQGRSKVAFEPNSYLPQLDIEINKTGILNFDVKKVEGVPL